jgi:hypothetical protein
MEAVIERQDEPTSLTMDTILEQANQPDRYFKTIAVRVEEELHAQLRFIAQLSGSSITDEIRTAIQSRVAAAQDDPELLAKAAAAHQEIEREAAARRAALAGFIGTTATGEAATAAAPKPRRGSNPQGTSK